MTEDIAVYVMTHGPECTHLEDYCIPLEIGAACRDKHCGILRDDTGDNISEKDRMYCELTGLYWMWKNQSHDIVGLYHYRRTFQIDRNYIKKSLETHDIILPHYINLKRSCSKQYISCHIKQDWKIMCDTLKQMYPEYYTSAKKVFSKKKLIPANMFIANRDIMNRYCNWLFPLLFSIEPKLDLSNRSNYQSRVIGFMSERLFTLWVIHNKLRIKHIPIRFITRESDRQNESINLISVNNLLSLVNSHQYSEYTKIVTASNNKILTSSPDDSSMKKMATRLYNSSKLLFYIFGKIYIKYSCKY